MRKLLFVVAGLIAGCVDAPDVADVSRGYDLLATLDLPEGGTIELGVKPTGGIVTMEYAPVDAPSVMNYYARAYDATPLELFTALAPDAEVPPALIAAHQRQVADEHRASAAPRRLPPPPDKAIANADYNWYYAADCSQAEDGGWFHDFWDTYNWSVHWYERTSDHVNYAPGIVAQNVQIHLCNDSSTTVYKHLWIQEFDTAGNDCAPGTWWYVVNADVEPQYRRQFRVTADPKTCSYTAHGENKYGYTGSPYWDLGETKP